MKNSEAILPVEVQKYFEKYSIPGWKIEHNLDKKIKLAVVIPAISEYENIRRLLLSLSEMQNDYFDQSVIIFVINNTKNSSDDVKSNNEKSLTLIRNIIIRKSDNEPLIKQVISSELNVGLVDASSNPLPEKDGGVGLARKIGLDLALSLFDYDSAGKNILICLDADCKVGKNYLSEIYKNFNTGNKSAAVININHIFPDDEEQKLAIICYELFLRYYVLGLKYAGSHYAFHTIGSAMACDHFCYIKSEGMNKRKAAEDFYFLQKIAKNYDIAQINTTMVYPSSRPSWRVPFGTGQRVNRYLSHTTNEYLVYSPQSFIVLKEWLALFNSADISDCSYLIKEAKIIHPELYNFLQVQKFEENWLNVLKNVKNEEQLQRQKIFWFDGFRTLKLIHHLRDTAFPSMNMFEAIDSLLEIYAKTSVCLDQKITEVPSVEIQMKYLELLRVFG